MTKLKSPLPLFFITLIAIALLALLGPEEKDLGANVRIVYLHGAWVLAAGLALVVAGLAGLAGLLTRRAAFHRWSAALGRTGILFWVTYLPLSLWAMESNWNGLFLSEPRFRLAVIFAVTGVLLQVGHVEQQRLLIGDIIFQRDALFAGDLAGTLFAVGIMAAAFMGLIIVPLSTAYAFSVFFGLSGSLDSDYKSSRTFYILFSLQLVIAALLASIPGISLFHFAIATQTLNAVILPLVFYYLIKLASSRTLMGSYANSAFQRNFTAVASVVIGIASAFTVAALFLKW